jgi:hypothetical protein
VQFLGADEAKGPASQEQTQVDVRPQHQGHAAIHFHFLVAAMALVDAGFVARQRHDRPQRGHLLEQRTPVVGERHAALGRDQFRFADAQLACSIAHAQRGFFLLQGAVTFDQRQGLFKHGVHVSLLGAGIQN